MTWTDRVAAVVHGASIAVGIFVVVFGLAEIWFR